MMAALTPSAQQRACAPTLSSHYRLPLSWRPTMLTPMSDETKSRLVAAGFAVPGMASQAPKRLDAVRECTRDSPCPIDEAIAWEFLSKMALTPGPVILLVVLAYSVGVSSFAAEGEQNDSWLLKQAERSRERRQERLRDLGRRVEPVQAWFGWPLVDAKSGEPTSTAYIFLACAAAFQLWLVLVLTAPIRDALS